MIADGTGRQTAFTLSRFEINVEAELGRDDDLSFEGRKRFAGVDRGDIPSQAAIRLRQDIGKPGFDALWAHVARLGSQIAVSFIRLDALLDCLHADQSTTTVGGLRDQLNSLAVVVRTLRAGLQTEMTRTNSVLLEGTQSSD